MTRFFVLRLRVRVCNHFVFLLFFWGVGFLSFQHQSFSKSECRCLHFVFYVFFVFFVFGGFLSLQHQLFSRSDCRWLHFVVLLFSVVFLFFGVFSVSNISYFPDVPSVLIISKFCFFCVFVFGGFPIGFNIFVYVFPNIFQSVSFLNSDQFPYYFPESSAYNFPDLFPFSILITFLIHITFLNTLLLTLLTLCLYLWTHFPAVFPFSILISFLITSLLYLAIAFLIHFPFKF